MIFPYIIQADKGEVFSEEYFQENFPMAWAYLNNFKEELSKRSINGSKEPKWYQFGRSQSLTRFHDNKKLIWSVLSTKAGYVFDENDLPLVEEMDPIIRCLQAPTTHFITS